MGSFQKANKYNDKLNLISLTPEVCDRFVESNLAWCLKRSEAVWNYGMLAGPAQYTNLLS